MKVSIIMPCFNVGKTIIRALDSIIMQQVKFEYEILVIDDASTDNTVDLVQKYAKLYPQIKLLCNKENKGNAFSYYTGLVASKGDYFCVLDGDDYYTIPDKLQRQVDFLDSDIQEEYVGTATQYLIDLGDDMVNIPDRSTYQEFSYTDFLSQHSGYYHTATYMYRNIFRNNVPPQISDILYRGDTPRTMFHLMYSGKKIKILDFIGSAYTFEYKGIWSGLKQKEQFQYQINYQEKHKNNVTTEFERASADKLIAFNTEKMKAARDDLRRYPNISIEQAIHRTMDYAGRFAFGQKDFVLKHAYYSSYIDSLCASLGYVNLVHHPECVQRNINSNNICIVNGVLNPKGGGIFAEINELIDIYSDKNVYLFVTNMNTVPEEAKTILQQHQNLTIICPQPEEKNRITWFQRKMAEISPFRCYYYCSHRDTYGAALAQSDVCENIMLFSFDHGYVCGISNAWLNTIIAKRPVDYWMLKKKFKDRVIMIPAWSNGVYECEGYQYEPFSNHEKLITASGAARYYKIDGKPPYRYVDLIIKLLSRTGGIHYHFGELPDNIKSEINQKLKINSVNPDHFRHIEWAENIPLELLKNHIDIFIEPFPVVSYKLTLQVLSIGIPVIAHMGLSRMEMTDFIPASSLYWRTEEEFLQLMQKVDKSALIKASKTALAYFNKYHSYEIIKNHLYENKGFELEKEIIYPDNTIGDIMASLRLFGNDFKISIMNGIDAEKRRREEQIKLEKAKKEKLRKAEEERRKKENEEKCRKEKVAKEKIQKLRSSKSFRLGFAITLPFRFTKQFFIKSLQAGPSKAIHQITAQNLMTYKRKTATEELYVLEHCAALRIGNLLATPYWHLHYKLKYKSRKYIADQLKQQRNEIADIKKILKEQPRQMQKIEQTMSSHILALEQKQNDLFHSLQCDINNSIAFNQNAILESRVNIHNIELHNETKTKDTIEAIRHINDTMSADCLKIFEYVKANNCTEEIKNLSMLYERIAKKSTNVDRTIHSAISKTAAKGIRRNTIEHLDYHLTEHCNLNCVGCSVFSPIADHSFADINEFKNDMTRLHDLIGDNVQQIHLLGGEPLLHPHVEKFAEICRSIFSKSRIDITTNGLLIFDMPESFWEVLKANNIAIKYTQYPIKFDYSKMIKYIKQKGVYVFSAGGKDGIKYFRRIPLNLKGTYNIYNSFIQCPYTDCTQLRDGKLYHCPASAFSYLLNRKLSEQEGAGNFEVESGDYLDLYNENINKDMIFDFLSNAIPFCHYCDMNNINEFVEWKPSGRKLEEWIDL